MEQHGECTHQPGVVVDHQLQLVVTDQRPVLDGRHALLDRETKSGSTVRVGSSVFAHSLGLFDRGTDLLAAVAACLERRAG